MSGIPQGSAASLGLACCHVCYKLASEEEHRCPRCGSALHLREPDSIQRAVALLITAIVLYIPANVHILAIGTITLAMKITAATG